MVTNTQKKTRFILKVAKDAAGNAIIFGGKIGTGKIKGGIVATTLATITLDQLPWQPTEQDEFSRLVREHQYWKLQEDAAKHERMEVSKRIESMLLLAEPEAKIRVQSEQWVVQRVTSKGADKLDGKLLLQQGVSATIIQNATVPGKPYSYVLISSIKE